ncbi:MAG: hypothetical protein ACKVT1_16150 [Dehalococcoidia bacterium]
MTSEVYPRPTIMPAAIHIREDVSRGHPTFWTADNGPYCLGTIALHEDGTYACHLGSIKGEPLATGFPTPSSAGWWLAERAI